MTDRLCPLPLTSTHPRLIQFNYGWMELEWVAMNALIVFLFAGAAPRLRKASLVRNHQTPSDFITDMFRSQLLRYATITIQLVAQFIWMTSNVVAVKNAFNTGECRLCLNLCLIWCCLCPHKFQFFLLTISNPQHSTLTRIILGCK